MNSPILIIFLASAVAYSYAATERFPAEQKPAEFAGQEGCYLSSLNRVLPYDTPYFPENEKCEQYTCNRNNETLRVTCGLVAVSPNCQATYNKQLKYPDCCKPTVVCDQTTVAPTTTTEAGTTTEVASTTPAPPTLRPQSSSASASASSQPGSAPVAQASASPGASAAAYAS